VCAFRIVCVHACIHSCVCVCTLTKVPPDRILHYILLLLLLQAGFANGTEND